jgi:hypothetical protein
MLHMEVVQKEADRWIGGREPGNNQHLMQLCYQTSAVHHSLALALVLSTLRELDIEWNSQNNQDFNTAAVFGVRVGQHPPVSTLVVALAVLLVEAHVCLAPSFPPAALRPPPHHTLE